MSRLEVPLTHRRFSATGDLVVRAELALAIKTKRGDWEDVTFLVDSGTEMTTMPAADAKNRGVSIPLRPIPRLTLHGLEVRSGTLRVRIPGMDATEYSFPCYFLGDPDDRPESPSNVLGLTGVIDQIRLIFDGTASALTPRGVLVIEKLR